MSYSAADDKLHRAKQEPKPLGLAPAPYVPPTAPARSRVGRRALRQAWWCRPCPKPQGRMGVTMVPERILALTDAELEIVMAAAKAFAPDEPRPVSPGAGLGAGHGRPARRRHAPSYASQPDGR